jgi:hypothetical protein
MPEPRWRSIAETVAAAGVIFSLIFVGFQIRQSTIQARAQAYQEIGLTVAEFWYNDALNPGLLVLERRVAAGDSLSADELQQFRSRMVSILRLWETLWLNVEAGALPPEALGQMGSWRNTCDFPSLREDWDSYFQVRVGETFADYVVKTCGLSP